MREQLAQTGGYTATMTSILAHRSSRHQESGMHDDRRGGKNRELKREVNP